MTGTMEIPTVYRRAMQCYEAVSSVKSQGAPTEESVFYESPTAYIRRVKIENGVGTAVPIVRTETVPSVDSKVDKEMAIWSRALQVYTGGKSPRERINDLRDQESASRIAMYVYRYLGVYK